MKALYLFAAMLIALCASSAARAGDAHVVNARVALGSNGLYTFTVTVRHDDEGEKHYADRWEVVGPDGSVIATRILLHPHVDEQPFTRSLSGVRIPPDIRTVRLRAHDSVHGYGGAEIAVAVPR